MYILYWRHKFLYMLWTFGHSRLGLEALGWLMNVWRWCFSTCLVMWEQYFVSVWLESHSLTHTHTHTHAHGRTYACALVRLPRYFCSLLWVWEWLYGTESYSLVLHSYASPHKHTNVFPSKHTHNTFQSLLIIFHSLGFSVHSVYR